MIDERNGGTIWQFLSRGSRNNQTNLRAGWLFLYFFTKNQLPEGEWIFRLFPEAWRPKINGKAGSMLNVLSSINEAFPSRSFTLEISQRIHHDEFSSEQRFSSLYAPSSNKLNLPIVSISTICSPNFLPLSSLPSKESLFLGKDIRKIES